MESEHKEMIPIKGSPKDIALKEKIQKAEKLLKEPTNSFTLLHTFYNENHDEHGKFAPAPSEGNSEEDLKKLESSTDPEDRDYAATIRAQIQHGYKEMPPQLGGPQWAFEGTSPLITSAADDILHGNAYDHQDRYRDYSKPEYDAAQTILKTLETAHTDQATFSGHHRSQEEVDQQIKDGEVFFPLVSTSQDPKLASAYAGQGNAVIYEFPKGSQGAWYRQNEYIQSGLYKITGSKVEDGETHIQLEQKQRTFVPPLELPDEETGEGGTYREEPALRASANTFTRLQNLYTNE